MGVKEEGVARMLLVKRRVYEEVLSKRLRRVVTGLLAANGTHM